ncbi:MAG: DUF4416 family protein [Candidatus Sulfobium sp.]|jgi:hypothetical protein
MDVRRGSEIAILFVGALYSSDKIMAAASRELRASFGEVLFESPPLPWNYTDYYAGEIGPPVFRQFLFFRSPVDASSVVDAKLKAMSVEVRFLSRNKRRINIDPGYMTLAKVVLVSRKNYSHRIYLGRGVFGETELFHKDGVFNALPYTYPDYRDEIFLDVFAKARDLLKKDMSRRI